MWVIYRYRATVGAPAQYRLGPTDRPHGFPKMIFFTETVFQFAFSDSTAMHVFRNEWQELTPEVVRDLFASALALPDDG